MGKSERLKRLLAAGYFPSELPPPFHTDDIAKYREVIGKAWPSNSNYKKSAPETFSSPRVGIWRRDLSIVNPVAQYYLSRLIAEEWVAIRKYLRPKNLNAQEVDIADNDLRSVAIPDWELIRLREQEISAEYDHILVADISRFYGTLYTHAIPWAMHTKAYCKKHLEPPRDCRRLFGLSYAAMSVWSSMA